MTFGTSEMGRGATHGYMGALCLVSLLYSLLCSLRIFLPIASLPKSLPPSPRLPSSRSFFRAARGKVNHFRSHFSRRARVRPNISCPSETPEGKAGTAERMDGEVGRKPTAKADDGLAKHDAITDRRDKGEGETRSTSDSNNIDMRRKR